MRIHDDIRRYFNRLSRAIYLSAMAWSMLRLPLHRTPIISILLRP